MVHQTARLAPDIETSSPRYARRFSGAVGCWLLKLQRIKIVPRLPEGSQVLLVGAGHGQLLEALLQAGHETTVQISPGADQGRVEPFFQHPACHFIQCPLENQPFEDQSFDVVIAVRLLAHLEQPQPFLDELARLARSTIMVDYPRRAGFNAMMPILGPLKQWAEPDTRDFRSFSDREVEQLFESTGFTVEFREPECFFPLAFHRLLKNVPISLRLEELARNLGLTRAWGSPVVLGATRS